MSGRAFSLLLRVENTELTPSVLFKNAESTKKSIRNCPTCSDLCLSTLKIKNIEVEACKNCSGIYFDHKELETLLPKEQIKSEPWTAKDWAIEAIPHAITQLLANISP